MNHSAPIAFHSFLEGDGIMIQQIKEFDWEITTLGPIQNWPAPLLTTLDTLLHSNVPMILFWGREHTVFYNDAFLGFLHRNDQGIQLNTRAADLWPELWMVLQPVVEETLQGRKTRSYEDLLIPVYRHGQLEDAYWNLNYSRIKDNEGVIQGVLVICNETTEKVLWRHQAEEMGQRLHFALEACDLGTWDLDPVTMTFQCNEKTRKIFGLSAHQNIDLNFAINLIRPDERQKVRNAISKALHISSGGHYDVEYSVQDSVSGEEKIIRTKGRAYFNSFGEPVRFSGTLQEITGDALVRKRKEKLQQLIEHSRDYVSMASLEGHLNYMNTAGRKLIGLDDNTDINTLHFRDFYSEQQLKEIQETIVPAMESAGQWSGFVKIRHVQTGEEIPCLGNYLLIKDSATGAVISRSLTLRDLRPELIARKELEDSEKRFRNLVQEAPVATAIYIGREMKIQWANDAMIKLWGKDKSVIGKTVREALPELEGQPFHQQLDDVFTTGRMYQATEDPGHLVVDGQLQTFYFNFSYKPLRDTEGKIYGVLNMAIDVTEGVKVKRKLEESEKNFRNLIMQAPVGICLLAGDDHVVEVANDEYLVLVGREREGFVGHPIWELIPEAKEQGFDRILSEVKQTGTPYLGNETPVVLVRNGQPETVFINFVYEPLFDENREVHSILVIAIDVTHQVEARKLVENAEERTRLAIESARLGAYEINLLTKEVFPSQRFNELFDVDASSDHNDYVARVHPDDLAVRKAAHETASATGKLEYECRVLRRDRTVNWLHIFGQFYFDEKGTPYKIIGIVKDITEEKLGEQEREKFLSLAHYSRDFIGMCDMNMKTLFVNKAGLELLGIDDPLNASLWDCFFEEDRAYLKGEFFPAVLRNGYSETEIRFRHFKTGQPIWMIYNVFLIRDTKGEPMAMATVSRDITDRKNMEQELERRVKERTEELTKLNEELQQFIYVSSHDLKEPLRKIQLFASLLRDEAGNDRFLSHLHKINSSASRMSTLLSDLLHYSTLSDTTTAFESIDLSTVVQDILEDVELLIQERNAVITTENLPVIQGIPFQINQLFYNLLNNALKFSKTDVPAHIHIRCSRLDEEERQQFSSLTQQPYYKIEVSDNGIGFSQQYAEKIFVVFQRLHLKQQYSGNGIGLSLCKKIVQNHKGMIYAHSTPDEGSVFTVVLPVPEEYVFKHSENLLMKEELLG